MLDEKERGETACHEEFCLEKEEKFIDKLSCGRLNTTHLWAYLTIWDNIIVSLGSKGRPIIYSLSSNWMLET